MKKTILYHLTAFLTIVFLMGIANPIQSQPTVYFGVDILSDIGYQGYYYATITVYDSDGGEYAADPYQDSWPYALGYHQWNFDTDCPYPVYTPFYQVIVDVVRIYQSQVQSSGSGTSSWLTSAQLYNPSGWKIAVQMQ